MTAASSHVEGTAGLSITPASTVTYTGSNGGDATAPTPAIVVMGSTGTAPHAVFVHALDTKLGSGTALTARYVWTFGSSGNEYNTLVGWNAAHTYDTPGTYKITLSVTNSLGKTRTLSVNVTVTSASARRTVYVDSAKGNDRNNGLTPATAIKTSAHAQSLLTSNTNLLFHTGETFPITTPLQVPYHNVLIGSYGGGAQPILLREHGGGTSEIHEGSTSYNIVVQDLTFDSIWVPVGNNAEKPPADGIFPGGSDEVIQRCTFLNLDDAVNEDISPQGTLVQDCSAPSPTGLRGVFIWGQGTDQVYLGNYVANSTREHIVRTVWVERELIDNNNFTNLDRSSVDPWDTSKGTIDVHRGAYAYVSNNWLYDGELRVGPRMGPSSDPGDTTQWTVLEGNHTFNYPMEIYPGTSHLMVRNNVFTNTYSSCIGVTASNSKGDSISDITFANNTGVTSGRYGQFIYITAGGTAGAITLVNNLWLAPNIIAGQGGNAAVYVLDKNANVLKLSQNNVWTMPKTFNPLAAGGVNYINATWAPPIGYYTPAAWNRLSFVHNDYFSRTPVSSGYTPASATLATTVALPVAGVFVDINGKQRPASGYWSAGAVQS